MKNLQIKALTFETWRDFARLVQKHNGVWGGCWCTAFHPKSPVQKGSPEATKCYKEELVKAERAHAALVFAGDICVAWYSKQKPGIRLMFWSGADFEEAGLNVVGKKFKDASVFYDDVAEIKMSDLRRWLKKAYEIQWDYRNLVGRNGRLEKLKYP